MAERWSGRPPDGFDAASVVWPLKVMYLVLAVAAFVALLVARLTGEEGHLRSPTIPLLVLFAMPAIQLFRSTRQLDGPLPRMPVAAKTRDGADRRRFLAILAVGAVFIVALLHDEVAASEAVVVVDGLAWLLLWRVDAIIRRDPDRRLLLTQPPVRLGPLRPYVWGEAASEDRTSA